MFSFAGNLSCDCRWETDTGRSKHPALGQSPSVLESFRDGESLLGLTMNRKVISHCLAFRFLLESMELGFHFMQAPKSQDNTLSCVSKYGSNQPPRG